MKTPEWSWLHHRSDFIDIFKNVSHPILVFPLFTLSLYLFAGIDEFNAT